MRQLNLLILLAILASCRSSSNFTTSSAKNINYSNIDLWAAHPDKSDTADKVPGQEELADQSDKTVDVFFIHPTTYTGKAINDDWNAPIDNVKLNESTDNSTIQYQASIFNQVGRVFAPRYRQAHIKTYSIKDQPKLKAKIFDNAYHDVKEAFTHYLENENNGRPIIIASHSQGTTHGIRLITEMIDGTDLQDQMIAAYLVGMPVRKDQFQNIQPCQSATETGCFVSWRTFKTGHIPPEVMGDSVAVTNPITWKTDDVIGSKEEHLGAILRNFDKVFPEATTAQIYDGILWADKPKFPFSFLFTTKRYHIADYNFYYFNVQENVKVRAEEFLKDSH